MRTTSVGVGKRSRIISPSRDVIFVLFPILFGFLLFAHFFLGFRSVHNLLATTNETKTRYGLIVPLPKCVLCNMHCTARSSCICMQRDTNDIDLCTAHACTYRSGIRASMLCSAFPILSFPSFRPLREIFDLQACNNGWKRILFKVSNVTTSA